MSTFIKCPAEVHWMALGILREYESHAPLLAAAGVKFDLVFALAAEDTAALSRRRGKR